MSAAKWIERREDAYRFSREVAPGLYVRSLGAVYPRPKFARIVLSSAVESDGVIGQLFMPTTDDAPIPDSVFECAITFARYYRSRGVPLVVQCRMGLSRSASVAYAILRLVDGLDDAEALSRVRATAFGRDWPASVVIESARSWVERVRKS